MVMWLLRLRMRFTRPMARNCHRLRVGPSSTRASLTYRSSAESALLFSALATAEFKTLATTRAALRLAKNSVLRSSVTDLPRMRSTTSRALRGATRMYFACALTAMPLPSGRAVALDVTAERAGERELAQLVTDHRLADEDGHVLAPIVNGDGVTDHVGEHCRGPRPGLDHLLLAGGVHVFDALEKALVDERTFLC